MYDAERNSILIAGEYIRTIIEESVFAKNRELGWEKWLFKNPDRTRTYDHIEFSSLAILCLLYLMSLYGIWTYWPSNLALPANISASLTSLHPFINLKNIVILVYILIGTVIFSKYFSLLFGSMFRSKHSFDIDDINGQIEADLRKGVLPEIFKREVFEKEGIEFSKKAAITADKWKIVDNKNEYVVSKERGLITLSKKRDVLKIIKLK